MKEQKKSHDFILALGLNLIFIIAYLGFFGVFHETNDDIAISFLLEGVYGERSPYVVYQNIVWGQFLVWLYAIIPTVKWYILLMYFGLFLSYLSLVYVLLRIQGRKLGIASSGAVLLFCGYYSYVVFQYSRTATVAAVAGLVLLFYGIKFTESQRERIICLVSGILLALWGSMLRFKMFALVVVLLGGAIGLREVWKLFQEKKVALLKELVPFIQVFGLLGVLSLTLYMVDYVTYSSQDNWCYYQEFNEVRTELWDYGFPKYEERQELYEQLGISRNDYDYYLTWNMDEEFMTLETLNTIASAKSEKTLDLKGFLSNFYQLITKAGNSSKTALVVAIAIVAILLSWKNCFLVLYEAFFITVFEAYFFYINRFGIARVDESIWMAVIITLIFGISEDIRKLKYQSWRLGGIIVVILTLFFGVDYNQTFVLRDGEVGTSKGFYQQIKQDKEHLYIILSSVPRIYYAYDFWEPSKLGDMSNIYNAYGWEFNVETKKAVLEDYAVENIYRDGINSDEVYFVADFQAQMLQTYIQENYNEKACLVYVKDIDGVPVWNVKTLERLQVGN